MQWCSSACNKLESPLKKSRKRNSLYTAVPNSLLEFGLQLVLISSFKVAIVKYKSLWNCFLFFSNMKFHHIIAFPVISCSNAHLRCQLRLYSTILVRLPYPVWWGPRWSKYILYQTIYLQNSSQIYFLYL